MPIEEEWFPERVRNPARKLRAWALTSSPGLLAAGVLALLHGASYAGVFGHYVSLLHPIERLVPMWAWATAWAATGAWLTVMAITRFRRATTLAFTLWAALMLIWSMSWLTGWGRGELDRGIALSATYFVVPLLVAWSSWLIGTLTSVKGVPDDYRARDTTR